MQVYKAYYKIIKKRFSSIAIYIGIFLLFAGIVTASLGGAPAAASFSQSKSNIAFFSGESTPLVNGLKDYLGQNANIVSLPDETQEIQDALFFGQISCVIRVPEGFTQNFLSGKEGIRIEKTAAPNQTEGIYMDIFVNKYLQTAGLYVQNMPGISETQLAENVAGDLASQASVDVNTFDKPVTVNYLSYYFQYLAYSIMAIMIMGITTVMITFNEADLSNRNSCAPIKPSGMSLQMLLANITFALAFWAVLCVFVFMLYPEAGLNTGTILLCLNALVFTFASLSIGFLAGRFIKSHGAQGAIMNVVALGLSFLSGVFIPQDMLGSSVLTAARFTPSYWYVKTVMDIRELSSITSQTMEPIIYGILIQAGFAAALMIVSLLISKQKKLANAYS